MSEDDWGDPFSEGDEAARDRARRRAEREARRRARRGEPAEEPAPPPATEREPPPEGPAERNEPAPPPEEPAERVEPSPPPPSPRVMPPATPAPPVEEAPPGDPGLPGDTGPLAEAAAPPGGPGPPAEASGPGDEEDPPAFGDDEPAGFEGASADPFAEEDPFPPAPETGAAHELDEHHSDPDLEPPPRPIAARGRRSAPGGGASSAVLWRRRAMAIGLLAFGAVVAFVGGGAALDRIGSMGGGAAEEPEPVEEAAPTITITIPEGFDRRQIANVAEEAGLRGNYMRATRNARGFNPSRFGAEDADNLEGFLFPATYEVPEAGRMSDLVERQLDAFRGRISEINMRQAEAANLNVYDVLKIASMIEREVQIPRERRLVAAVIYNRLSDGSPLGIDATIRYEDQNYSEPLTQSRLADPTPFNTRIHAGLPPTPIGNPGEEAIRAAANPADSDAFFYVVKPYTCGEHVFTASEQEFLEAVAEYQRALEEEGGAPTPDDC